MEEAPGLRILFWGTPAFAVPPLRALTEEGFQVVGVVTQPDRPAGRGRAVAPSAVKAVAVEEGIPVLQPERARGDDFLAELRALEPDLSVVVAYGQILPQDVLDLPTLGSINIHASLLPELRGAAPIQWSIIRGLGITGISIMRMEAGLDSGPVLYRVEEAIRSDDSGAELASRLSGLGAEALVEALALLSAGLAEERPQDHAVATYAPKLDRETARIRWDLSAGEVARWIRGLDDVPGAWSPLGEAGAVKLFRPVEAEGSGVPGEVLSADEQGVRVACGSGAVLVREVQPSGKRRMPAAEWVRGRGVASGGRFG